MIIAGYILVLLLTFYLLAKIVEDYFVGSLDKIAHQLKMSSDAAGATLMAVGSSAPELFVALFSVLHPGGNHEALGVGSIVGSALFNVLAITGAAVLVRKALLAWQPIVRDLGFYALSVLLLLWAFGDGNITLIEVLVFLGLYLVYVLVVVNWRKMTNYIDPNDKITVEEEVEVKGNSFLDKVKRPIDFVVDKLFPSENHYYLIFIISIVLIAGLSWVLVESAVNVAHILNISEAIIGVTILAAGTSIPDMLSSIIVSKQGRGGMAISNAVGSNIFDILVGLGLPMLIIISLSGGSVTMNVGNIMESVEFLLASVFFTFVIFAIAKWKVGRFAGILMLGTYLAYVVWAILTV